ncbi:hypothetical protein XELAEV_18032096mg [Xenopus laevis]|uniref:Uncharacterized protein n=1 Tax=Xenopus laevis TaxID=8355 RepID=A0A974HG95_XENLA|nr:hypothetical protein XELAEV_18032096mg [Xenopus laevis]
MAGLWTCWTEILPCQIYLSQDFHQGTGNHLNRERSESENWYINKQDETTNWRKGNPGNARKLGPQPQLEVQQQPESHIWTHLETMLNLLFHCRKKAKHIHCYSSFLQCLSILTLKLAIDAKIRSYESTNHMILMSHNTSDSLPLKIVRSAIHAEILSAGDRNFLTV